MKGLEKSGNSWMKEKQETVERIREIRQQLDEGKADKVM